jgi:tetratricopeptide (TPR) repeat protein
MHFHDIAALTERLASLHRSRRRPVVLLVGSPLAAPDAPSKPGVPNVAGMIELIRSRFNDTVAVQQRFDEEIRSSVNRYHAAFEFLIGNRGQDDANAVIQTAVLQARAADAEKGSGRGMLGEEECRVLEEESDGWALPVGIRTLGRLLVEFPNTFGGTVLTTNFDPLIEMSILRHGGAYLRTVLHRDGDIGQTVAAGCHVVHLHGYWHGHDTLHTPRQLQQARPRLHQRLSALIADATIVVIGYGGWDDVFTRALAEVAESDIAKPDVLWTFRSDDPVRIGHDYVDLLKRLAPALDRGRVALYSGIDCNSFFPRLREELTIETTKGVVPLAPQLSSRLVQVQTDDSSPARVEIRISLPSGEAYEPVHGTDSPPQIDLWVGREHEVALLDVATEPVVVISGIGGQGKSTLAAYHVNRIQKSPSRFENWDWRDCKEEGDRLHTQIIGLIYRLAVPQVDPAALDVADIAGSVDVFFHMLDQQRWLFVFDNVDRYVDLETGEFTAGLDVLMRAALERQHQSRFIFTCRPQKSHDTSRVLHIPLSGLSDDETLDLFRKRGVQGTDLDHVTEAFELTGGHPMWINVIAVQVTRMRKRLPEVLAEIKRGRGDLPEKMLRAIWATLNDNQITVLRTLGEMERPETPERIGHMLTMHWNRYERALRTLTSLNLIVIKSRDGISESLELHPLLKQFIRKEFPKKDRERYIGPIVRYLEGLITRFRPQLEAEPGLGILQHWTQKAELDVNRGYFEEAIKTIAEVAPPLLTRGFPEELVRIGTHLFDQVDWGGACLLYKEFHSVVELVLETMIQFGLAEQADRYLALYEAAIPGKSAEYINLCDLRCYGLWFNGSFEEAIAWGEQGEALKARSGVDTKFTTAHNLALARRDHGLVDEALDFFLRGQTLEDLLNKPAIEARGGSYYGNIGRCLQLKGRLDDAIIIMRKSAILLETDDTTDASINRGYIRRWIAEVLRAKGDTSMAALFYRAAIEQWLVVAPRRAREVEPQLIAIGSGAGSANSAPWVVERKVRDWLSRSRV